MKPSGRFPFFQKVVLAKCLFADADLLMLDEPTRGMDMISLGATIQNPHSPGERLHIPSVGRVWQYLTAFMESYR